MYFCWNFKSNCKEKLLEKFLERFLGEPIEELLRESLKILLKLQTKYWWYSWRNLSNNFLGIPGQYSVGILGRNPGDILLAAIHCAILNHSELLLLLEPIQKRLSNVENLARLLDYFLVSEKFAENWRNHAHHSKNYRCICLAPINS